MPISTLTSSPKGLEAFETKPANNNMPAEEQTSLFGEDGFTFGDIIDIVNPLQHIPIVSSIYRKITGDDIAPAMQIAGGALFGGPLGAVTSAITTAIQSQFNEDGSADPDSPYRDNNPSTINPATVAFKTEQSMPKPIGSNDYSNSTLQTGTVDKTNNPYTSIDMIQPKRVYQSGDGIINLAHNNTEVYSNVISARSAPGKSIDIIIGSAFGTG